MIFFAQVDDDVHNLKILDAIVDYRKDSNAVDKVDMRTRTKSGYQCNLHTTFGWYLLILWKNQEEEWTPLN